MLSFLMLEALIDRSAGPSAFCSSQLGVVVLFELLCAVWPDHVSFLITAGSGQSCDSSCPAEPGT